MGHRNRTSWVHVCLMMGIIASSVTACTSASTSSSTTRSTTNPGIDELTPKATTTITSAASGRLRTRLSVTAAGPAHSSVVNTTVFTTLTSTITTRTDEVQPPSGTVEPPATDGSCPYLTTDAVERISGQRQGKVQTIEVHPQPVCIFYRTDGDAQPTIRVRIVMAGTDAEATAAVDQHVPVADSVPADQPPGWTGGSSSTGAQGAGARGASIYAVSKGKVAIVVESNAARSVVARTAAVCALLGAGLVQKGPELCTHGD